MLHKINNRLNIFIILTIISTLGCSLKDDCVGCNCSSSSNLINGELKNWTDIFVAGQKIFVTNNGEADTFKVTSKSDQLIITNGNCSNIYFQNTITYIGISDTNKSFNLRAVAPAVLIFNESDKKGLAASFNVNDNTVIKNPDVKLELNRVFNTSTKREDPQLTFSCDNNNSSCLPYYMQKFVYSKDSGLLNYDSKDGKTYRLKF